MRYYSIGTVVLLKNSDRALIIYGRMQRQQTSGKVFDYVACLYPEGNLREDYNVFFEHEEIETVVHMGFQCELENQMQEILQRANVLS